MKKILIVFLALVLTACLPPSGDVTPPIIESSPTPEYTPTVNPEAALAAWVTEQVTADISQQPYLQALEEITDGAISQACVDFATRLGAFEENLSANHAQYTFRVSADGICYVTTADGTVIVDAENNAGFLYLTPSKASQALGVEVASVSADGRNGSIGDAYDASGRRVGGVSRLMMQWETVNEDGVLPSEADPSSVPPTPVNTEQSNVYQVNYAEPINEEAQAQAIAKLAADYDNGNVTAEEIDKMSFEQRKEFSIALNEYRNKLDGEHSVTYTDESGNKLYFGPDGKFHSEKQSVESTLPSVIDGEGYIHVFNGSEWIKIEGSPNIQFKDFENFAWPETELTSVLDEKDNHPLTMPEWLFKVSDGSQMSMLPIIVLSKETGEMNIPGLNDTGTITVYVPHENDRYSVDMSIIFGNVTLYADGVTAPSPGKISEFSNFWKALEENTLYYTIIVTDQKSEIAISVPGSKGQEITAAYQGIAPTNLTTDIIIGKIESKDITLINTQAFVKKFGN